MVDESESEKVTISVPMASEEFVEAALEAGWSDDPGTGKSILLRDEAGRGYAEIPNPAPMAAAIENPPTDSLSELIALNVAKRLGLLSDSAIEETEEEADDFDVDDDLPDLSSVYEIIEVEPQAPYLRPVAPAPADPIPPLLDPADAKA